LLSNFLWWLLINVSTIFSYCRELWKKNFVNFLILYLLLYLYIFSIFCLQNLRLFCCYSNLLDFSQFIGVDLIEIRKYFLCLILFMHMYACVRTCDICVHACIRCRYAHVYIYKSCLYFVAYYLLYHVLYALRH